MSTAASPRRSARAQASEPKKSKRARSERSFPWMAWATILIPIVALPLSFFVWYSIISLGSYPADQQVGDLVVGLLSTALFHAFLLLGILFGVVLIRAARRAKKVSVVGWIGAVLGVLVIIYWELLVSPWIVDLWNKATGAA
jgi:hypothetical protein